MATRINRLEKAVIVSMVGYLADYLITNWMIYGLGGYEESNQNLLPQVGLPLMVLNFMLADRILPKRVSHLSASA